MASCRALGVALVSLTLVSALRAQTYELQEINKPGDCFRLHLNMQLNGYMSVNRGSKQFSMHVGATAEHEFCERTLSLGKDGCPDKTCRFYTNAKAQIGVERDHTERTLRQERAFIVTQRYRDRLTVYSPAGPLMREELEVTGEHLDTLAISGLLPSKAVKKGDAWKVSNSVVQALCGFEGLTEQSLECKLDDVNDRAATILISGSGTGIELGALVKAKLSGSIRFDLKSKRIDFVSWIQNDERDQGPASPASKLESITEVKRILIDQPESLSDVAIVSVPDGFEPAPSLLDLSYQDVKDRFHFTAAREWQTVSKGEQHVVLRLMESGEFIAQATVTPWTKTEAGKHLSSEEFRRAMDETPGWQMEQELQAGEVPSDGGRWIFRLATQGSLDGAKVMQNFYLVAGPKGDQVVVAFTFAPKNAERLATRDLALAASIQFERVKKNGNQP